MKKKSFCLYIIVNYLRYIKHVVNKIIRNQTFPVAPGVCNIEMIKECAEEVCGCKLFLSYISQCRFSALITPDKTPNLNLRLQLDKQDSGNISFHSVLFKGETVFLDMKGELQHV